MLSYSKAFPQMIFNPPISPDYYVIIKTNYTKETRFSKKFNFDTLFFFPIKSLHFNLFFDIDSHMSPKIGTSSCYVIVRHQKLTHHHATSIDN